MGIGRGIQIPTLSDLNGFGENVGPLSCTSGKTYRSFYFGPNGSFKYPSGDNSDVPTPLLSFCGLIGWQWFLGDDLAIGLDIGMNRCVGSPQVMIIISAITKGLFLHFVLITIFWGKNSIIKNLSKIDYFVINFLKIYLKNQSWIFFFLFFCRQPQMQGYI